MCGICGFCDYTQDNGSFVRRQVGHEMGRCIDHRGPDDKGLWQGQDCVLVHRRLAVIDPERGRQPMTRASEGREYVLVYNGELYNAPALRRDLECAGYQFSTACDTEVLLYACMEYGTEVAQRLEGIFAFAFWDEAERTLFLCRDRMGVKPLFYARAGECILFSSEIKSLFAYPGFSPRINEESLCQVLGIGPARIPGSGVFADVHELLPAHWMKLTPEGCTVRRYWQLESRAHSDNYEDTVQHVRELVTGAIRRQLVSDVPLASFLSGGLDSSIIAAVGAAYNREKGLPPLETYSFDYVENEKYFKPSAFQPDSDAMWAQKTADILGTKHTVLGCDVPALSALLDKAMHSRDLPGMADVDSSLLYFCGRVKEKHIVALSGECADEVFGGYPWFERPEMLFSDTFPWAPDLSPRKAVVRGELWNSLHVEDYVQQQYRSAVAATPYLDGEDATEMRRREVGWLSIQWFMACLLERKDRMSMASGLEVRVPFCDHHLIEYVWNIPWQYKTMNGQRKQVLRDAAYGLLPEEIRARPKSPYPKTHNPLYEKLVRSRLVQILDDKNAPIHDIIDGNGVRQWLEGGGGAYGKPWFGQLMAGPQMLAYLIQMNQWMKQYQISI